MDSGLDQPDIKKKKNGLDEELEDQNSFLGLSETQGSGGHENTPERKMKQLKNTYLKTRKGSDTELEAEKDDADIEKEESAKDGKKKTKKHKDVHRRSPEGHEIEGSPEGKKKKKNKEAISGRKAGGEFEKKPLEYNERGNDKLDARVTRNDSFEGEDIVEKVKKKKKKHSLGQGFEQKDTSIEENCEESVKEKKKKKKKKRKRDDIEEEEKVSNEVNLAEDEGTENGAGGGPENPESSAKSKSKEKRKKKPKDREVDSGVDADQLGKPPTDHRPLIKKQKKVSFSNHVEVCGAEEMKGKDTGVDRRKAAKIVNASYGDDLIWGRFTKEEDQKIRDSVAKYIKEHGFEENEGLEMILNCGKYGNVRNCWKEISKLLRKKEFNISLPFTAGNLPWRDHQSVYIRAHVLYERSEEQVWTKDEIEFVKSFEAEHGKKWNKLAKILGKSRYHVKDKWRSIRRGVMNTGKMSQEEYQRLFDLVNYNLRLKASQVEAKPTRRKIRKNINWEAIADKMETRDHVFCCKKWYSSLTSSMVDSGEWNDGDDFILLRRLLDTNAFDEETVEWDDLLEDRSGEICCKRWKQMEKHLGEHRSKTFLEKLELLVRRYAPELIA